MKQKIIKLSVILLIMFGVYKVGEFIHFSHVAESIPSEYLFLFKDSIKQNVDTFFAFGLTRKSDIYYDFEYKKINRIMIFEYNELLNYDINNIKFITNQQLNVDHFIDDFYGELYNEKTYPLPETYIDFRLNFENGMSVRIDKNALIKKTFEGKNYRGFYGDINKISFSNSKGKEVVFFDYKYKQTPTLFVIYSYYGRFFVIMINSENKLDPNIINILNLEG